MDTAHAQSKHPASPILAGPYGHPFHPILVTVPIGAWISSLVFDVASWLVAEPAALRQGSTWLIGIGVVGAVAAAMVGTMDLFVIPTGTPAFRLGLVHMTLNLVVTVGFAANFVWRQSSGDSGPVAAGMLALSIVCIAVLAVSGYLGGKLAYHYGVRVADETTQAAGFVKESTSSRG
ncbi:MAG TPA: DUF2231 domain-containing protein [Actinopolymorphaceae bacterium]